MTSSATVTDVSLTLSDGSVLTISARITEVRVGATQSVIPTRIVYQKAGGRLSFGFASFDCLIRALESHRQIRDTNPG